MSQGHKLGKFQEGLVKKSLHCPPFSACQRKKGEYLPSPIRAGSSAVEQLAFNQLAEGSIPSPRTTQMASVVPR